MFWLWLQAQWMCCGVFANESLRLAEINLMSFQSQFFTYGRPIGDTDRMVSFDLKKKRLCLTQRGFFKCPNESIFVRDTKHGGRILDDFLLSCGRVSQSYSVTSTLARANHMSIALCLLPTFFRVRCHSLHHLLEFLLKVKKS